jgi:putative transposase
LTGEVKKLIEDDIKLLCEWKKCELQEMSVQSDHIHIVLSIPPKVSVSELMGILKGKLAIKLFKGYPKMKQKPYLGNHFWAHGYFASTVRIDEEVIMRYVKYQEEEEKRIEEQQHRFDF